MERKVGEIFEFDGKLLQVVESEFCDGCYFNDENDEDGDDCIRYVHDKVGSCFLGPEDISVIFKEVKQLKEKSL